MSSPATIPRTFINMSSSPIDLTISPIIISSDTEEEVIDSSHNSNYRLNDNNNNLNSALGFDNQNSFNSSRHSSNNNQDSPSGNINYSRSGLAGVLNFMFTVSSQANNNSHRHRQHNSSAFHPYSLGSSRTIPPFLEPARTNTNINRTPSPSSSRRRTNNSPKPTTLIGHARDLDDSHTLICANCNELLHEKLWALSTCGHVVCGSCVDKYLEKKRFECPSCKKMTKPTTLLQLYV